jgi:two-component system, NtrC family, nitrogen regulation sensor histidine kinase NtrY
MTAGAPPRARFGMTVRTVLMIVAGATAVVALHEAFRRVMPSALFAVPMALAVLAAIPVVFVLARYVMNGGTREAMMAVSDGLLALAERDYTLRLASNRGDEVGVLVRRFNNLTDVMRGERNDSHQREQMLEIVLGATPMIAVICDEGARVVYANAPARAFLGEGRNLEGRDFSELVAAAPADVRAAIAAPGDVLFTCDRPAAEPETYHLTRRSFEIATRRHTLYLLRPLTKELARKEVDTWKKAIRVLSHEVNNSLAPIASLIQSSRMMLANPTHASRLPRAFDTIEERAKHLQAFLEGYASFARLPQPSRRAVSWKELFAAAEGLFPFQLGGALPERPAFVDPAQMQQVLINLLKNAVESGSPPDQITVEVEAEGAGDGAAFLVMDRGKGMSDEVMKNALLPFYSTKRSGTGLGLSLCREIVDAHGGRLSLHPRTGGGVSARCWLPY